MHVPTSLLPPSPLPFRSRDYSAAEREAGLHRAILAWASESRSQRGSGSMARAAAAAVNGTNGSVRNGGGAGGGGGGGGGSPGPSAGS